MSFVAIFSDASEVDDPFQWKPQENLESVPDDMIGSLSLKIEEESSEGEIEEERYRYLIIRHCFIVIY